MERPARDLHGHHCIAALIRHAVIEKAGIDRELEKVLLATTDGILEYARWIEEIAPGFIALIILAERGEDYRDRDLLDQVACLIEIFGVAGAAQIVGCP